MKVSPAEKFRIFLANWVFTTIYGMALDEWMRLLWKHRFAVDPPYWPRAAFITGTSLLTSVFGWHETRIYAPKVLDVEIKPPLFILGHWRSGTTHLHNLLALDKQFACPNVWQVLNPHTFLSTEKYAQTLKFVFPKTRIMDNMSFGTGEPFEDEFAVCGTLRSPFLIWVFPRWADHYQRYLAFQEVPEAELMEWKAALTHFYKKLTWKYNRPLLLKSPPHTCRIRILLEMFPGARFVHIHRNPYTVFQSTKRQIEVSFHTTRLQNSDWQHVDSRIIQRYKIMYDVFFEERRLIPAGQFHEVCYEELEADRVGQIRNIYEKLNLSGFDTVLPSLQRYLDSIAGYRKNEYPELSPALRGQIAHAWRRNFEEWGYAC